MEYRDQLFTDELDSDGKLAQPDHRTLTVDLNAAVDTTKLAIHYLKKNGKQGGNIILTASIAGYLGFTGAPLYTAAKHGVVGLVRCLKAEVAKVNISISCVAPGITVTPLLNAAEDVSAGRSPEAKAQQMAAAGVAVNRVESVALAVCFLLNEGTKVSLTILNHNDVGSEIHANVRF
jgi:NAD(P)-dependent dehydrogenase (short-subunit alcohol dehydrogenase family)